MTDMAHGADEHAVHEHHWEVSWAPMAIAFGSLFLVPLTFASVLVYNSMLFGIIFAGIGVPLLLAGIGRWVYEGATHISATESVAPAGIGVFIIGEVLIFLGLFVSYWTLRLSTGAAWPPAGTPEIGKILPLIMTVILVTSESHLSRWRSAAARRRPQRLRQLPHDHAVCRRVVPLLHDLRIQPSLP